MHSAILVRTRDLLRLRISLLRKLGSEDFVFRWARLFLSSGFRKVPPL